MTQLSEIAHSRAGDKGDTSIIVVAPYDPVDFVRVGGALAVQAIAQHFAVPESHVMVRAIPNLSAYTVVIRERLDGGVTRSRSTDPHGKTLSGHILDLQIAVEPLKHPDDTSNSTKTGTIRKHHLTRTEREVGT